MATEIKFSSDSLLPHLAMVGKLGSGTYATVYSAQNTITGEKIAIKLITNDFFPGHTAGLSESTLSEIDSLYRCKKMTNIIQVKGVDFFYGKTFIYLEPMSGDIHDLWRTFDETTRFSLMPEFLYQMLMALNHLDKLGIYHLDIKPGNILWRKDSTESGQTKYLYKLTDFGLAGDPTESDHDLAFSLWYRPPEYLVDNYTQRIAGKGDLWALAMTALELLRGFPIFPEANKDGNMLYMLHSYNAHLSYFATPDDFVTALKTNNNAGILDVMQVLQRNITTGGNIINKGVSSNILEVSKYRNMVNILQHMTVYQASDRAELETVKRYLKTIDDHGEFLFPSDNSYEPYRNVTYPRIFTKLYMIYIKSAKDILTLEEMLQVIEIMSRYAAYYTENKIPSDEKMKIVAFTIVITVKHFRHSTMPAGDICHRMFPQASDDDISRYLIEIIGYQEKMLKAIGYIIFNYNLLAVYRRITDRGITDIDEIPLENFNRPVLQWL